MLKHIKRLLLQTTCDVFSIYANDLGVFISAEDIVREQEEKWEVNAFDLHLFAPASSATLPDDFVRIQNLPYFEHYVRNGDPAETVEDSIMELEASGVHLTVRNPDEVFMEWDKVEGGTYFSGSASFGYPLSDVSGDFAITTDMRMPPEFYAERDKLQKQRQEWRRQLTRGHHR